MPPPVPDRNSNRRARGGGGYRKRGRRARGLVAPLSPERRGETLARARAGGAERAREKITIATCICRKEARCVRAPRDRELPSARLPLDEMVNFIPVFFAPKGCQRAVKLYGPGAQSIGTQIRRCQPSSPPQSTNMSAPACGCAAFSSA